MELLPELVDMLSSGRSVGLGEGEIEFAAYAREVMVGRVGLNFLLWMIVASVTLVVRPDPTSQIIRTEAVSAHA